jgi:S1-C subfamily serine protease
MSNNITKFVHPIRFFKTHSQKNNNNNRSNNNLIKVIIISFVIGLIGGIFGQITMNYLSKKNLLSIIEQSKIEQPKQNFLEKQIIVEKKDEIIINQDEKIQQLIPELMPTIVNIYKKKENQTVKNFLDQIYSFNDLVGNGFIITNDGWIISNDQVIEDSIEKYTIVTNDGKFQEIENLIKDPLTGIVFLKIKSSNNLTAVKFIDWDEVKTGQSVVILNKTNALENQFILSNITNLSFKNITQSKELFSSSEKIDDYILIQDKIEFNYNGSPLFNFKGEVVGILTREPQNANSFSNKAFLQTAIGINFFKNIINKTLSINQINRPYFGARYLNLNNVLIKGFNHNGALILAIEKNSPIFNKLKEGDIVVKVENEEIKEKKSLTSLINEYQPNQNIKLTIIRDKKETEVKIKLK